MRSFCPLIVADLKAPIHPRITCSDVSLDGMGDCVAIAPASVVEAAAKYSELLRLSTEIQRSWGPRRQAFEEAFLSDKVQNVVDSDKYDDITMLQYSLSLGSFSGNDERAC